MEALDLPPISLYAELYVGDSNLEGVLVLAGTSATAPAASAAE
jgi:hypothetical protein